MPTLISTTVSTNTSWTRTHDVVLPETRQPAEHLVMVFGMGGNGGSVVIPDGWSEILGINVFSNDNAQLHVWIKELDGTEPDSYEISTPDDGNKSVAHVLRISGARAGVLEDTTWNVAVGTKRGGTISEPPSLTPDWGADDTLWIVGMSGSSSGANVDVFPTSYINTVDTSPTNPVVATCSRENNTATESPSQFEISTSNTTKSFTLGLRPAAAVVAGAGVATAAAQAHDTTIDPPTTIAVAEVATAAGAAYWATTPEQPVPSDVVIEWDLDGDGDFDETEEDITGGVLAGSLVRGRDYASQVTGRSTPGRMTVMLDNTGGKYNRFNTSSPLNTDPFSTKGGRLIRVRTSESTPNDPTELVRAWFNGAGPLSTADTGETWTTRTSAGFSEFQGEAIADGPPTPASSSAENPGAFAWDPLENSGAITFAVAQATGETLSIRATNELVITGGSSTFNVPMPATVEADDILIALLSQKDSTDEGAPTSLPTDWVELGSIAQGGSFAPRMTVCYKIADGTEDSTTPTFGWGSSLEIHAVTMAIDGADTTTPFPVSLAGFSDFSPAEDPDPPSISPGAGTHLIITAASADETGGTPTPTVPSGYTLVFDQSPDNPAWIVASKIITGGAGTDHLETIDVGESSYYMQAVIPERDSINEVGLVFYYTDDDNYGVAYLDDGTLVVRQVLAGVASDLNSGAVENRKNRALGVETDGGNIHVYLDGVKEFSTFTGLTATSTAGLWARWYSQRPPSFDSFRVWDQTRVAAPPTGFLGTMRVSSIVPSTFRDHSEVAVLTAVGTLRQLERPVTPPESTGPDVVQSAGISAGHVVGNVFHKVGLLDPPANIDDGDLTLGSVGLVRQRGISVVRRAEETELGFVYERTDGGVGFDKRSARDGTAVVATFTDDPLVPGFGIETIEQRAWEGDVINQVRSEVSPSLPRYNVITDSNSSAVSNDVSFTIPSEGTGATQAEVGDLLIVAIASSVQGEDQFWETPVGWVMLAGNDGTDQDRLRIFAREVTDGDFGDQVFFYNDLDLVGGAWVQAAFVVKNWYGAIDSGLAVAAVTAPSSGTEARSGTVDPPVMFTPWPIGPTLFLVIRAGIRTNSGGTVSADNDDNAPAGFDSLGSIVQDGASDAFDVAMQWARRIRTESVVNPGVFGGEFSGYNGLESTVIAVRGFAGTPPPQSGGDAVESNNTQSQLDRGAVLAHPHPGILFSTEADALAYNNLILERFDQDRPIVEVGFTATRDAKVRAMCTELDLSDRVRIDADGVSGYGIDAEFFVETISHEWGEGGTSLVTRFACSPATDAGGGAD